MNYKRKGHRGRGKRNTMDNNNFRCHGNSQSKPSYYGGRQGREHQSASQRNRVEPAEMERQ